MSNGQERSDVPDSPSVSGMPTGVEDLLKQLDRVVETQPPAPSAAEGLRELMEWMTEEQSFSQEQSQRPASLPPADAPSTQSSTGDLLEWDQQVRRISESASTAHLSEAKDSAAAASRAARDQRPADPAATPAHLSVISGGSLALTGRLDVRTAADVRSVLHQAVDITEGDLVLDLKGLRSWDATGLGVIMGAHRRATRLGRRLVLRAVPQEMRRLLVATRLHRILSIEDSIDESPVPPLGLGRFNTLPADSAKSLLLKCCAASRWAQHLAANRPYPDLNALLAAADEAIYDLRSGDVAEALAHEAPDLSSADHTAAHTALRAAHAAYEARFGHAFVICLDGVPPEERLDQVLNAIRARLPNEPEEEQVLATEELRKLTRSRLIQLTADAATEPASASAGDGEMNAQLKGARTWI